jgi:siroheme synthase (precorrin-2 oxidase/ferrochelatase)
MFLKLAGRRCLVVGAGAIAESKIESLLLAGARVTVVAPEAADKVRRWAGARKIVWRARATILRRERDPGKRRKILHGQASAAGLRAFRGGKTPRP